MKRGDVVKMKKPAARFYALIAGAAFLAAQAALRVGVIIEVIEDVPNDRYVVYWSDNIKSTHWATDLEMK